MFITLMIRKGLEIFQMKEMNYYLNVKNQDV